MIIKFGSSNLLYLALTLMVPLGNVAFTLPFVPGNAPLQVTDIVGLIVICLGLGCYRFAAKLVDRFLNKDGKGDYNTVEQMDLEDDSKGPQLYSKLIPAQPNSHSSSIGESNE